MSDEEEEELAAVGDSDSEVRHMEQGDRERQWQLEEENRRRRELWNTLSIQLSRDYREQQKQQQEESEMEVTLASRKRRSEAMEPSELASPEKKGQKVKVHSRAPSASAVPVVEQPSGDQHPRSRSLSCSTGRQESREDVPDLSDAVLRFGEGQVVVHELLMLPPSPTAAPLECSVLRVQVAQAAAQDGRTVPPDSAGEHSQQTADDEDASSSAA